MARPAYQPCSKHQRAYCLDAVCKSEENNAGDAMTNTSGGVFIELGNDLAVPEPEVLIDVARAGKLEVWKATCLSPECEWSETAELTKEGHDEIERQALDHTHVVSVEAEPS
jgi:hypothetical protein